jgi:hypothetical protein
MVSLFLDNSVTFRGANRDPWRSPSIFWRDSCSSTRVTRVPVSAPIPWRVRTKASRAAEVWGS